MEWSTYAFYKISSYFNSITLRQLYGWANLSKMLPVSCFLYFVFCSTSSSPRYGERKSESNIKPVSQKDRWTGGRQIKLIKYVFFKCHNALLASYPVSTIPGFIPTAIFQTLFSPPCYQMQHQILIRLQC